MWKINYSVSTVVKELCKDVPVVRKLGTVQGFAKWSTGHSTRKIVQINSVILKIQFKYHIFQVCTNPAFQRIVNYIKLRFQFFLSLFYKNKLLSILKVVLKDI